MTNQYITQTNDPAPSLSQSPLSTSKTEGLQFGQRVSLQAQPDSVQFGNTVGAGNSKLKKDLPLIMKDFLNNLKIHPALKYNALIFSTLILVFGRISVAHGSAIKQKGTSEGVYRYQEAIKTTIREMLGWTLSYAVFRALQNTAKRAMRVFYEAKPPVGMTRISAKQIQAARVGDKFKPMSAPKQYEFIATNTAKVNKTFDVLKNTFKMEKLFEGINKRLNREVITFPKSPAQKAAFMKGAYKAVPLLVGAFPAVYLSGYWLENFTQNNFHKIVDWVSTRFNQQAIMDASTLGPKGHQLDFQNYMMSVQTKRAE